MNFSELTEMVIDRIQKLERQNFKKIMGIILFNDPLETQMMELAFGPEDKLISTIEEIKTKLGNLQNSRPLSPPAFQISNIEESSHIDQPDFFNSDENYYSRTSSRSLSHSEIPIKTWHHYNRGYLHGPSDLQSFRLNELQIEDHDCSSRFLEKLETEITELLRAHRGVPVLITSLPNLYYEMYGKNLDPDWYLTETQRHGKAGFDLIKLLGLLKNSIRLIERPLGLHFVILEEAVPRYLENRYRTKAEAVMVPNQIYITFAAKSTFTETDIFEYFKQFGPVKEVKIPSQERRMFGYVSFFHPETVTEILMKQVPHYIRGSWVVVKPAMKRSGMIDMSKNFRTQTEKIEHATNHPSHYVDLDSEFQQFQREFEGFRGLKNEP